MTLDDLNNLDFEDPGSWPLPVKFFSMILLCGLILAAGWYFDWQHQWTALAKEEKKETELLSSLETKQKKAANLDALKRQMEEMQQSFGDMLRQLPNKTEVAGLLVDISQTGLAAGLEFELFKPGQEVPSEFYAELPIQIGVVGDYHKFGEFISGIASLPRIVTTHDISITTRGKGKGEGKSDYPLAMSAIAKTYRALDEEEFSGGSKKPAARKRGGRR